MRSASSSVRGFVTTPYEEALELAPDAFGRVELGTVGGQVAQLWPLSFPGRTLFPKEVVFMEGCMVEHDNGELGRVTASGERIEIAADLGLGARAAEFTDFKLLGGPKER